MARAQMTPAVRAIVEQERAFSAASVAKSTRDAFMEYLADDSLLFRPGPVPGKMFIRNRPAPPGKLVWAPTFADAASSEDIGYTTGPYEFRKAEMTETPQSWGHFVRIWRKQRDGAWKVEVELGISHEKFTTAVADVKEVATPPAAAGGAKPTAAADSGKPAAAGAEAKSATPPKAARGRGESACRWCGGAGSEARDECGEARGRHGDSARRRRRAGCKFRQAACRGRPGKFINATRQSPGGRRHARAGGAAQPGEAGGRGAEGIDREFSKAAADQGAVKAFGATVSPTIRVYRNGNLPVVGKAAVEAMQANALGTSWQPAHARVSASGDFGYTTGMISMGAAPTPGSQGQPQYYVRVWRKDKSGAWKVELDIVN